MMSTKITGAAVALLLATPSFAVAQSCPSHDLGENLGSPALQHIRFLADDRLEGRLVGSPGERCAGDYIAARFQEIGLEPAGEANSFFQTFPARKGAALTGDNVLIVNGRSFALGSEWSPTGYSASDRMQSLLVWGGQGVSTPGDPNDPFTQIDVRGKILVVEPGAPQGGHGSIMANPHFKATVAAGREAAGVLLLLDEGESLPELEAETRQALKIPVAAIHGDAAEAVRSAARLEAVATLQTGVSPVDVGARNVVALLPGVDPSLKDEYVIVGAHYDHLGYGGDGSLAGDVRAIHNGADDNASGTGAMIEIARALADGPAPARSILFIAFTGEEKGLWGANYFVANPTIDLERSVAMLNLDMVGRMQNDGMTIFGFGTASEWDDIVDAANAQMRTPLNIAKAPDGFGPSDHAAFHGAGLPVLHLFTNTHSEYHRPDDDWELINADGVEKVVDLTSRVARRLAEGGDRTVTLTPVQMPAPGAGGESSGSSGYGEGYLGSIPDMAPNDDGMRLTGVREGSPAEKGGLRSGDVIVQFNGRDVTDIYTYTFAMQETKPDDEVEVVILRDGERMELTVVMGRRN